MCRTRPAACLSLTFALAIVPCFARAQDKDVATKTLQKSQVVAGSPKDFLEVRHLVLKGDNEQIGYTLAEIAKKSFGLKPAPSEDRFQTRVQRRYIEKHYPILFERMTGVAAAFGKTVNNDAFNFSGLWTFSGIKAGCSVVYFPPNLTSTGNGVVSRDYDFTTGTLEGRKPAAGELAATARPYVIEMHPDRGYSSIAVCCYDMLSGVLDGINSEGLTVALLADDELTAKYPIEPAGTQAAGLGIVQVLRMLLDTCANVEEAKEALMLTKQVYELIPVHYLIADRHGHAFVWEYSQVRNREYIIENPNKPLITTNFSLHKHMEGTNPPSAKKAKTVCDRYCALTERLTAQPGKLTIDAIKETHKAVDFTAPNSSPGRPPTRTLWHALYFPEQRRVQVSFYLRDEADAEKPGKTRIVRSDYLEFSLGKAKAGTP